MSRTSAREYALKVLYSRELNPESEPIEEETLHLEEKDKAFADALIEAAAHEDVDDKIKAYLKKNWSLTQLNVVDKNILRLAIAEFKFRLAVAEFYHSGEDRPDKKVIINEAIELAKTYGGEGSYRFINGLLDKALQGE